MNRAMSVPESDSGVVCLTSYIRAMSKRKFWTTIEDGAGGLRSVLVIAESNHPEMTIYGLVGSDMPKMMRYVGRTMHPHSRFEKHMTGGAGKIRAWVEYTRAMGERVCMVQLELCLPKRGDERENFWLQFYKAQGMADLNTARVLPMRRRRIVA